MLQSIATCWPLLCLNNLVTSSRNIRRTWLQCMPGRVFTPCVQETWQSLQDKFYESKTSSRFPNFDTSNAWQLGHDSSEGIFLGQELLLDFAAWLDLTSNADNTITVYQLPSKFQSTFWFFKTCWWLLGLSRLYDASQPPGRHTRYFKTMLKILVDRGLMRRLSFLLDVFRLTLDRFTCCVHVTITDVNNLFPDFHSIYAMRFDFDFIHYK